MILNESLTVGEIAFQLFPVLEPQSSRHPVQLSKKCVSVNQHDRNRGRVALVGFVIDFHVDVQGNRVTFNQTNSTASTRRSDKRTEQTTEAAKNILVEATRCNASSLYLGLTYA